jgi:hypothetical protein
MGRAMGRAMGRSMGRAMGRAMGVACGRRSQAATQRRAPYARTVETHRARTDTGDRSGPRCGGTKTPRPSRRARCTRASRLDPRRQGRSSEGRPVVPPSVRLCLRSGPAGRPRRGGARGWHGRRGERERSRGLLLQSSALGSDAERAPWRRALRSAKPGDPTQRLPSEGPGHALAFWSQEPSEPPSAPSRRTRRRAPLLVTSSRAKTLGPSWARGMLAGGGFGQRR